MKTFRTISRYFLPLLGGGLLLAACGGSDDDTNDSPAAGDGTVTWTHNGQTYTSTAFSSAIVDGADKLIITGGSTTRPPRRWPTPSWARFPTSACWTAMPRATGPPTCGATRPRTM